MRKFTFAFLTILLCLVRAGAQSPNATITGLVLDPSGAVIVGADIIVVSDSTGIQYTSTTNGNGVYVVANLPPGSYRIQVSNSGFKTIVKPGIVVHLQDALAINFTLPVGAASEIVTVQGGAPIINTENAAVSTIVDRTYVENMPLNGRSFQDLLLLTPGVVTNSPQPSSSSGEFSVNGQRTESNYYIVDGVSANLSINPISAAQSGGLSGSLPAATTLGTTQGLVSLDSLEEFRIQTSTYSAEYGRSPGGQFSFVTRAGTNQLHGVAFEFLRNDVFDANDWFNNYLGTPKPPLRQNDFGGTLGGPVEIPHLYRGTDRTFFFFSYEGLRLTQPQAATVSYVPTIALRQTAPAMLQPVLNAFPLPECPANAGGCSLDLGNGLGQFAGTWSDPNSVDAASLRLDHAASDRLRLFFRWSGTSSASDSRFGGNISNPAVLHSDSVTTHTYTFGATVSITPRASDEFRLNYSSNEVVQSARPTNFGGAAQVNLAELQGFGAGSGTSPYVQVTLNFLGRQALVNQSAARGTQHQWNIVDTVGLLSGKHQLKAGVDLRRLSPTVNQYTPVVLYIYASAAAVSANSVDIGTASSFAPAAPLYTNFSSFLQDEWKLSPHLNLSLGLRWEVNPAPGAAEENLPYTVRGADPADWELAPPGTPLWNTAWFNFAPRLGAAYLLGSRPGFETVVRGGVGVFFDTAQQVGSYGYSGPGFSARAPLFGALAGTPASFPLSPSQVSPPIVNPPTPPYSGSVVYAFPGHLQLPYTLQWNASIQQALGKSEALTLSYVGANGRKLLAEKQLAAGGLNPNFGTVIFFQNGLTSDYNAFQAQFQRRLSNGLQALASYTWSHAIDSGSQNAALPYRRGNSDYDVRHSFSAALSYDIPDGVPGRLARALLTHWGIDDRFTVRTGFPVALLGASSFDPPTGLAYYSGLNLVAGQPVYIYGAECAAAYDNGLGCPGGRAINPNAFSLPAGCTRFSCSPGVAAGTAPRNFVRGFGAWQMDLAIRREFWIRDRWKLQFRAEAFNVFNHPNFGKIDTSYCPGGSGCTFGQATATLANSLVGLSSLYQPGGPRSMQLGLKLKF